VRGRVDGPSALRIYENVASEHNWLRVRVVGRGLGGSNRAGIGARVRVTAGGVTQTRDISRHVGPRGPVGTELVAHFGLGAACDIESGGGSLARRRGHRARYTGVRANYEVELREGDAQVRYPTVTP
jgi:hypothetical protein